MEPGSLESDEWQIKKKDTARSDAFRDLLQTSCYSIVAAFLEVSRFDSRIDEWSG
jgi:hypothetical protein